MRGSAATNLIKLLNTLVPLASVTPGRDALGMWPVS